MSGRRVLYWAVVVIASAAFGYWGLGSLIPDGPAAIAPSGPPQVTQ